MKTINVKTEYLFAKWRSFIKDVLLPEPLLEELDPATTLADIDVDAPVKRQELGTSLDILLDALVDEIDNPQKLWNMPRETDPELVALYFDRILGVSRSLEEALTRGTVALEIPYSWKSTARLLLLQRIVPYNPHFLHYDPF